MNIIAIKTNDGFYISLRENIGNYHETPLLHYFYDGIEPEATFMKQWIKIPSEPKEITKKVLQPDINHRYELIDPSMETKEIKPVFIRDDVAYKYDYDWVWKEEYKKLRSLYEHKSDKQAPIFESMEFEFSIILEIDEIKNPDFSYTVQKTDYSHEGTAELKGDSIEHQILDKIIFPDIVLPQKPSSLTSEQSYKIVRQHVKDNINPAVSEITSDYEFCFTVKKKIKFSEPVKYTVDVNNNIFSKRKRKPKFETRYRKERLVEVFEMTHTSYRGGYEGYTPIKGFRGENHEDLKKNIDIYLDGLMEFLNKPLEDCPACKGHGVIVTEEV